MATQAQMGWMQHVRFEQRFVAMYEGKLVENANTVKKKNKSNNWLHFYAYSLIHCIQMRLKNFKEVKGTCHMLLINV